MSTEELREEIIRIIERNNDKEFLLTMLQNALAFEHIYEE